MAVVTGALVAALLTACRTPEVEPTPDPSAPACVEVAGVSTAVHLKPPAGFRLADGAASNAVRLTGELPAGREQGARPVLELTSLTPRNYDDNTDREILARALTLIEHVGWTDQELPEPRTVDGGLELTVTSKDNRPEWTGRTLYARLLRVDAERFTVAFSGYTGSHFDAISAAVIPTLGKGRCPRPAPA